MIRSSHLLCMDLLKLSAFAHILHTARQHYFYCSLLHLENNKKSIAITVRLSLSVEKTKIRPGMILSVCVMVFEITGLCESKKDLKNFGEK